MISNSDLTSGVGLRSGAAHRLPVCYSIRCSAGFIMTGAMQRNCRSSRGYWSSFRPFFHSDIWSTTPREERGLGQKEGIKQERGKTEPEIESKNMDIRAYIIIIIIILNLIHLYSEHVLSHGA